jgi:hypothetical protein
MRKPISTDDARVTELCNLADAYLSATDIRVRFSFCAVCNHHCRRGESAIPLGPSMWVNHLASRRHRFREAVLAHVGMGHVCLKPSWERRLKKVEARWYRLPKPEWTAAITHGPELYPYIHDIPHLWAHPSEIGRIDDQQPTPMESKSYGSRTLPRETCEFAEMTARTREYARKVPDAWVQFLVNQFNERCGWRPLFDAMFTATWGNRLVQCPLGSVLVARDMHGDDAGRLRL